MIYEVYSYLKCIFTVFFEFVIYTVNYRMRNVLHVILELILDTTATIYMYAY